MADLDDQVQELREKVRAAVDTFEQETGVIVTEIELQHVEAADGEKAGPPKLTNVGIMTEERRET